MNVLRTLCVSTLTVIAATALFVTPGLGDASYLLASGREAVLVDPQRDAWRFLEVAQRRRWRIRHVL